MTAITPEQEIKIRTAIAEALKSVHCYGCDGYQCPLVCAEHYDASADKIYDAVANVLRDFTE